MKVSGTEGTSRTTIPYLPSSSPSCSVAMKNSKTLSYIKEYVHTCIFKSNAIIVTQTTTLLDVTGHKARSTAKNAVWGHFPRSPRRPPTKHTVTSLHSIFRRGLSRRSEGDKKFFLNPGVGLRVAVLRMRCQNRTSWYGVPVRVDVKKK